MTLAFDGEVNPAAEYQIIQGPTLSRTRIKIYGEDRALNAIDTVYTERLSLSDISDTVDIRAALAAPRNTRLETDSVDIRLIAERFTEKKFTVPLRVKGVPEGYHIRLFPKEVEVSVRVGISHFAQIQAEDIHAYCTYSPERTDKLDVDIHYTNPYITAAWAYPGVVEFILEQ